ncbi:hypothetical protein ACTPOE_13430 [Castellaniella sp. WN]
MSITSNYFQTHTISSSYIDSLKVGNRKQATHMSLWDKFIDLFRSEKKQTALNALYDAVYGEPKQRIEAFNLLKSCAHETDKSRFTKTIDADGIISFHIDEELIGESELLDVLAGVQNISDIRDILSGMPAEHQIETLLIRPSNSFTQRI